jgi:hypothetical protein
MSANDDEASALPNSVIDLQRRLSISELKLEDEKEREWYLEGENERLRSEIRRLRQENEGYCRLMESERWARPGEMCVRPRLGPAALRVNARHGFIIMPFGPQWASKVDAVVTEALRACRMRSQRADRQSGREIMKESWIAMCAAELVVADMTGRNPNVMYELGLADAAGLDVILIGQSASPDDVPFDLQGHRILVYSAAQPELMKDALVVLIDEVRKERTAKSQRGA